MPADGSVYGDPALHAVRDRLGGLDSATVGLAGMGKGARSRLDIGHAGGCLLWLHHLFRMGALQGAPLVEASAVVRRHHAARQYRNGRLCVAVLATAAAGSGNTAAIT